MKLNQDEEIVKIIYHHPFPFIVQIFKALGASLPFFFMLYLVSPALSDFYVLVANLVIIGLFTLVIIYMALIYWMDKLIITTRRVVYIDWEFLTLKKEYSGMLNDIQEISSQERGILSAIYLFDYGVLKMKTASSKTMITFTEAPDPDGLKAFLTEHIKQTKTSETQLAEIQLAAATGESQ